MNSLPHDDGGPLFDRVWYWKRLLPERRGHVCRVLARGELNAALVEFVDGQRVVTTRLALRRVPQPGTPPR